MWSPVYCVITQAGLTKSDVHETRNRRAKIWETICFHKKQQLTRRNARQQHAVMLRTVRLHRHNAYTVPLCCPITLTWRIHCPLTRSNNKHDAHTVLLVLKSGWWPITFEIFIKVFPTNWPNSLSRCKNLANSLRCSYSNQAYWLPLKHHILPERWKLG